MQTKIPKKLICGNLHCSNEISQINHNSFRCLFCKKLKYCSKLCAILNWKEFHHISCKTVEEIIRLQNSIKYANISQDFNIKTYKNRIQNYSNSTNESINFKAKLEKNELSFISKLGEGYYSNVFLYKDKISSKKYAIKVIKNEIIKDNNVENSILNEISIHQKISHPNIIKFIDFFKNESEIAIFLEYAEHGNLYKRIHKKGKLEIEEALFYFIQLCGAIQFLHSNQIIHRDLKPENVLINENNLIKLIDFGLAATLSNNDKKNTFCGTLEVMAPEILDNIDYDEKVDIWSLGIILYEMLNGFPPFQGDSIIELKKNIFQSLSSQNSSLFIKEPQEIYDLIFKMLSINSKDRPSINEILNSKLIKEFLKDYCLDSIIPFNYNYHPVENKIDNFDNEEEKSSPVSTLKNKKPIKAQSNWIQSKLHESDSVIDFKHEDAIQMTPSNNLNLKKIVDNPLFVENKVHKEINLYNCFKDFPSNISSSLGLDKKEIKSENKIKKTKPKEKVQTQNELVDEFDENLIPEERDNDEKNRKVHIKELEISPLWISSQKVIFFKSPVTTKVYSNKFGKKFTP